MLDARPGFEPEAQGYEPLMLPFTPPQVVNKVQVNTFCGKLENRTLRTLLAKEHRQPWYMAPVFHFRTIGRTRTYDLPLVKGTPLPLGFTIVIERVLRIELSYPEWKSDTSPFMLYSLLVLIEISVIKNKKIHKKLFQFFGLRTSVRNRTLAYGFGDQLAAMASDAYFHFNSHFNFN